MASKLVKFGDAPKAPPQAPRLALGVDLGTTHSVVALSRNREVEILPIGRAGLYPSLLGENLAHLPALTDHCFHDFKRQMEAPHQEIASHVTPYLLTKTLCQYLQKEASETLGQPVQNIVLTVPARFSDRARKATREAAKEAGFNVIRLLNEPTAAALAYGFNRQHDGIFLVYDLGGGTFDATLLRIQQGVFQILGTTGDLLLGGHTLDQEIVRWWGQDANDPLALAKACRLKEQMEDPSFTSPLLPREVFDGFSGKIVGKTLQILSKMLADTLTKPDAIQGVILVGGSTRLPQVPQALAEMFGQDRLYKSLDPDRAVAVGAALHAEALTQTSPTERPLLLDVIPASLGLETAMNYVETILPRYTPTPVQTTVQFSTMVNNQTAILIHVLQGDALQKADCVSLGQFVLRGIPPMPKGQPKINVTFFVDEDGILTVKAEELLSRQKQTLVLEEYFA